MPCRGLARGVRATIADMTARRPEQTQSSPARAREEPIARARQTRDGVVNRPRVRTSVRLAPADNPETVSESIQHASSGHGFTV